MHAAAWRVRRGRERKLFDTAIVNRGPSTAAAILFAAFGALLFVDVAAAATDTWIGTTALWSTGGWTGGNSPPIANDSLVFGTAGSSGDTLTNDLTAALQFNGITFNSGASAFVIGGNSI